MKQNALLSFLLPLLAGIIVFSFVMNKQTLKTEHENSEDLSPAAFSHLRNKYMFDMVKDPVTGKIPDGVVEKSYQQALMLPERATLSPNDNNTYLPAGALNAGGRTRTVAYDVRYNGGTNRVILAGAVSGGIFRSADGGTTWARVSRPGEIHNVHWIVQDSSTAGGRQDIWYAGGGEQWGNTASENGAAYNSEGIYRSTDNGLTWLKLPLSYPGATGPFFLERFDHPFDYIHKIAINPNNGHLYIGSHRRLMRSTDFGVSWEVVFVGAQPSTADAGTVDVAINNQGRIYIAVNGANDDPAIRGIWTSLTGNNTASFTRLAGGSTLGVDSVNGWRGNSYLINPQTNRLFTKRIILTLAPSNNNIMYVAYENGATSGPDIDLWRVDLATNTWTNRSANVPDLTGPAGTFTTQGGYDLFISVKPNDPNFVLLGGVNLFRSTDGFATTTNTKWVGGYLEGSTSNQTYPNQHPDQHWASFRPDNLNEVITATDGGLHLTTNITAASVTWSMINNYQTFQYYYVAIDPGAGRNNFTGGLQDNTTWVRDRVGILGTAPNDSNNHIKLFGGDGGSVGLAFNNGSQQNIYFSTQLGTLIRKTLPSTTVFPSDLIAPTGLTPNGSDGFGEFVTNFKLNPTNTEDLFYINFNRLFRTTSASTVTSSTWTEMTGIGATVDPTNNPNNGRFIRALAFSWGPYLPTHSLYIGTTDGRIFRMDNPRNAAANATPVNISIPGLTPPSATDAPLNIQDIAVNPNNDNEVMVVFSNYSVTVANQPTNVISVWWTNNAKSATPTWVNAEGSLPTAASARSCAIVVKKDGSNNPVTEYYVGTSVGLYSVVDNTPSTPPSFTTWFREGGNVLNLSVVQSLAYRPVDNVLLVGTHGNGMYFTYLGTPDYRPNGATGVNNQIVNDRNFIKKVLPTVSSSTIQYQTGTLFTVKRINVQLYNNAGQEVYRSSGTYQNGAIDISRFAAGNYTLVVTSDDGKYKHVQQIMRQ